MKRLLLLIWLIANIIIVPLMVEAATYSINMTLTESSGNTYTQSGWRVSIDNAGLASAGYITTSGLDARVEENGTAIPTMLATDRTMFSTTLPANTTKNLKYTLGNTSAASFPVIVGRGGYVTTADNAALELGNDFSVVESGYIDTTAGTSKYLMLKPGAIATYVSGAGSITSALSTSASTNITQAGGANYLNMYTDNIIRAGEKFTAWPISTVTSAGFYLSKNGAPTGIAYATVRSVSGDTLLGTLGTLDVSTLDGVSTLKTFNTTQVFVPVAQDVRIQVEYSGGDVGNYVRIRYINAGDPYAGGVMTSYIAAYSDSATGEDIDFNISYSTVVMAGVSVTIAAASGVHTINTYTGGGNLNITVDGGAPVSAALGGASVLDSAASWIWDYNNVMPYMNYNTVTVTGVEQLKYQPVTIVTGSSIPNTDAGVYPGTITWGTNPSGVATALGTMVPAGTTSIVSSTGVQNPAIMANSPGQGLSPHLTGTAGANFMGYDLFNSLINQYNAPNPQNPGYTPPHATMGWFWQVVFGLLDLAVLVLLTSSGSALITVLTTLALLGIESAWGVYDWWVPVTAIIFGATILIFQSNRAQV